ncbi:MAG: NIPSNAP family protein [Granulosicoccus sp.]|nr:NIPSNAP family protein [Granulosicoccus sp.]
MAFFEIRQYKIKPGKMKDWVNLMHSQILPFQVSKGMVVNASYQGEEDDTVYFWIRRFESEAQREALYEAVYQSDTWKDTIAPQVVELMDREAMIVHRVNATSMSPMQ